MMIVAAAALFDDDGAVLVQRRPPGGSLGDLWEFPGGKLEADESPEAALVRELFEELGIEVRESALLPFAFASEPLNGQQLLLLLYECRAWSGVPRPIYANALQWVKVLDLPTLAMPPADRPLVKRLCADFTRSRVPNR